jgi:hypothetical protein
MRDQTLEMQLWTGDQRAAGTGPNLSNYPNTTFVGTETITYDATDGTLRSNTATVTIIVTAP